MRRVLPLVLLAISSPILAQAQAPAEQPTIVVTGQRIQDLRDALARCLARHCPPNEDADATLALAEGLFLNGDYHEGRNTLQASLRRNRRHAASFPEPVSDLYRAHSRLSRHLGEYEDSRRSAYGILSALQEGLPQEDHRHFTARLELSEQLMQSGNFLSAKRELEDLVRVARAAGREDVGTIAELRILWFQNIFDPMSRARGQLEEMTQLNAPADRMRATGARLLLARLYRAEGNDARADALLAEVGRAGASGARRRLLYSPPYELQVTDPLVLRDTVDGGGMTGNAGGDIGQLAGNYTIANTLSSLSDNFEDKWIDVGYWVMPDGRVSGFEIVRNHNNTDWSDPLVASIRGRIYTTGTDPTYRLERYTYTAGYRELTGSHIRRRTRAARVETLDLTTNDSPPPPEPSGGSI